MVPAYSLPPDNEDQQIIRILVKINQTRELVDALGETCTTRSSTYASGRPGRRCAARSTPGTGTSRYRERLLAAAGDRRSGGVGPLLAGALAGQVVLDQRQVVA